MARTPQAPVFLLLLLLLATICDTGVKIAEGSTCETQSKKYSGTCLSSANCKTICGSEGFPAGGECQGWRRRRCYCCVAEKRKCETMSQKFKGRCWSHSNCKHVCGIEGFPEGACQGVVRRSCICIKPC